jgi:hypothetical protein
MNSSIVPDFPGRAVVVQGTDQAEVYTCARGVGPYGIEGDFGPGDDRHKDGEFTCYIDGNIDVRMGDGNDGGTFGSFGGTTFVDGGKGDDFLDCGGGGQCELRDGDGNDIITTSAARGVY